MSGPFWSEPHLPLPVVLASLMVVGCGLFGCRKSDVPVLRPPPAEVLRVQGGIAIPTGYMRGDDGRVYCEMDGAEMVLLPAGGFTMGSNDGAPDEKPAHQVFVRAYLMDRHEVTVRQFRKFCAETGTSVPPEQARDDACPVAKVTWGEAIAYAEWAGKRLPTEAEYERALRGGLEGKKYPWGDQETPRGRPGNYADESLNRLDPSSLSLKSYDDGHVWASPAGSFDANGLGLHDISGNVWEWCSDWYGSGYYATLAGGVARNPRGPPSGKKRVIRGGGWYYFLPGHLRCAYRHEHDPSDREKTMPIGFRTVRELP